MKRLLNTIHFAVSLTGCKICDRELCGKGECCWYWPWPHRLPPHRALEIAKQLYSP